MIGEILEGDLTELAKQRLRRETGFAGFQNTDQPTIAL
jgi:hypothetical protein